MTLEIACGATANYVPHLAVMLRSLVTNTPRRPLRVWLMAGPALPEPDIERLAALVEGAGAEWRVLPVSDALTAAFPKPRYFHASIWHRLLLPELLPQLERVLYLDADMVIADDLGPLWDTPLGTNLLGAVVAPFYPSQSPWPRTLGICRLEDYFSSGVLLLDLAGLRAADAPARLRSYAASHPDNPCPEQDALNALFQGRCLKLEPRWNAQPILFDTPAERLPYERGLARRAAQSPAVVHYSGIAKPWGYLSRHPLRHLYFEHLRQTPWPAQPLEGRTPLNRLLRLLPPRWVYYVFRALEAGRRVARRGRQAMA